MDTAGKTHKLSDFKGQLVVLEWTNPGCPFVAKHYGGGNMQGLQKEFTGKGVVWLAVNSTEKGSRDYLEPGKLAGWMKEQRGAPTATLMDAPGQIGQLYGAKTTPYMYIVSPQGQQIYAGGIDSVPSARVDDMKTATNYCARAWAKRWPASRSAWLQRGLMAARSSTRTRQSGMPEARAPASPAIKRLD